MIAIIAGLCSLSSPADCHDQLVTKSDFADISMQSCLMGAPQLADWDEAASGGAAGRVAMRHLVSNSTRTSGHGHEASRHFSRC
jgi:hypothetical protein